MSPMAHGVGTLDVGGDVKQAVKITNASVRGRYIPGAKFGVYVCLFIIRKCR